MRARLRILNAAVGSGLAVAFIVDAIKWSAEAKTESTVFGQRITCHEQFEAKLSSASWCIFKNIVVVDPSPKESAGLLIPEHLKVLDANWNWGPPHDIFWRDSHRSSNTVSRIRKIEISGQSADSSYIRNVASSKPRRGLARIFPVWGEYPTDDGVSRPVTDKLPFKFLFGDVSPQLKFGSFFGPLYKSSGGTVKPPGGNEKTGREERNQRIGDLKPIAKERRPELGSFLSCVLLLVLAFWTTRWWLACPLIVYAVFGLLLGLDPWTMFRWVI